MNKIHNEYFLAEDAQILQILRKLSDRDARSQPQSLAAPRDLHRVNLERLIAEDSLFTVLWELEQGIVPAAPSCQTVNSGLAEKDEDQKRLESINDRTEKPDSDKGTSWRQPSLVARTRWSTDAEHGRPEASVVLDSISTPTKLTLHDYHSQHHEISKKYGSPTGLAFQTRWVTLFEVGAEEIDFGKMQAIADVHQCVLRGTLSHRIGHEALMGIDLAPKRRRRLVRMLGFGGVAVSIGIIAFEVQEEDIAPTFVLGAFLGWFQLVAVPTSKALSTLFPFLAALIQAFVARALSALRIRGERVFHCSPIVSASLAGILPSYTLLIAAVELQGANVVQGSIRFVASIIYSMTFSFGLASGITLFDYMAAPSLEELICKEPSSGPLLPDYHGIPVFNMLIVGVLTLSIGLIFQANWRQMSGMALVTMFAFLTETSVVRGIPFDDTFKYMVSGFFDGLIAQAYARWSNKLAVIYVTPTLFIIVPGGLLAQIAVSQNGGVLDENDALSTVLNMVHAAIGISLGLALSSLLAHPQGPDARQCRCQVMDITRL